MHVQFYVFFRLQVQYLMLLIYLTETRGLRWNLINCSCSLQHVPGGNKAKSYVNVTVTAIQCQEQVRNPKYFLRKLTILLSSTSVNVQWFRLDYFCHISKRQKYYKISLMLWHWYNCKLCKELTYFFLLAFCHFLLDGDSGNGGEMGFGNVSSQFEALIF